MTTYILTITCIDNGKFGYSSVEGVFLNLEDAKSIANKKIKEQQRFWETTPTTINKVIGHMTQVELKHPTMDYVKIYSLEKVETA